MLFDPETTHERQADHGPHASGWQPGDHDPNTAVVHDESLPGSPGIAAEPKTVSFNGVVLVYGSRPHFEMLRLGYTEDPED